MQSFEDSAPCLIAFGSNLPFPGYADSQAVIRAGLQVLAQRLGRPVQVSALYQSEPVPPSDQPLYINGVAMVTTAIAPEALLALLLEIERNFGRERSVANAARTLDLDLIAQGDRQIETSDLILPHPRMQVRGFVLKPLCDLAPNWQHPSLGVTAAELLSAVDISDLRRVAAPFELQP